MQTHHKDLFTIMDCHFQGSISQAMQMAVYVQIHFNTGESEYESTCAYYYLFLFSGWWFKRPCTLVALNGKYNPSMIHYGFVWYSQTTYYILPITTEMKIRRR